MSLPLGSRLGHYDVLGHLGAGGMGDVYRAKDTKLDREVAIKMLPAAVAHDRERIARFEREGKVLASLNHPNIGQIYGVEESAGVSVLVMELVAGSTLSIPQPLDTAVDYARQIAEALEATHEKGVIHRDLKPSNIMVTPDGVVKILDFGLASVASAEPASDPSAPTATIVTTQAGTILGTVRYMSPEQAAGKAGSKRSDIWSFGVVLYEMLTGARLFDGRTNSETLADVMRAPIDFAELPKDTPPAVRMLLRRCLDRDLKTRLRDIGEARILLADVQAGSLVVAEQPGRPRAHWLAWSIAALLFVIATGLALLRFRDAPQQTRAIHMTLLPPEGTEFDFTTPYPLPAISPDGSHIVLGAKAKDGKTQLWLRRLDSPTARPLPGTENSGTPFWSPDSRWVAFGQERKLKKIDIHGGPPVHVADLRALWVTGGSWNTNGTIILGINNPSPILRVEASGGTPLPVTGVATTLQRFPSFLPDGRHFLYINTQPGEMPIQIGSLDEPGKQGKKVAETTSAAVYAQGHLLYLRDRTLLAQPFDPRRLEVKGEATPIAEGVPTFGRNFRAPGFAVSPSGLLVYASGGSAKPRLVWRDRQGKLLGSLEESLTGTIESIELSPDGKRVAVTVYNPEGDLWICDTVRGVPARFTFDPQRDRSPVWSADGNLIYFASNRNGPFDIYRKAVNGAGSEELLLAASGNFEFPNSVSPDGKLLLYSVTRRQTIFDLFVVPLTQNTQRIEPRLFLQTPFHERYGRFRQDGTWVAYVSNETGQPQVYVAPFPGPGGKRQISINGGLYPRWRKDGKEIFYVALTGELMAAEIVNRGGTLEVGQVHKLFDGFSTGTDDAAYDVSADGQKILVVDNGPSTTRTLTVMQNWTAMLVK